MCCHKVDAFLAVCNWRHQELLRLPMGPWDLLDGLDLNFQTEIVVTECRQMVTVTQVCSEGEFNRPPRLHCRLVAGSVTARRYWGRQEQKKEIYV